MGARLPCGVAYVCSLCWMASACQLPLYLCHQACPAAPHAAPADLLHPGVAGAADLPPVAVSSGARREWLEACFAGLAGSVGLVLTVDDIDSGHSVTILEEGLLKHPAAFAE